MLPLNVDLTLDINDLSRMILRYSYRAGAMRQVRVFVCVLHVSLRCGNAALKLLCYSWCSATSLLGTCALSIRVFQVSCGPDIYSIGCILFLCPRVGGKENSWATYFVGLRPRTWYQLIRDHRCQQTVAVVFIWGINRLNSLKRQKGFQTTQVNIVKIICIICSNLCCLP